MKIPFRAALVASALLAFAACRNEQSADYSTGETPDDQQNQQRGVLDDVTDETGDATRPAGEAQAQAQAQQDEPSSQGEEAPRNETEQTGETEQTPPAEQTAQQDIVATAKAAGNFSTLLDALDKAGLVATLEGDGPFTVFAPTDAAFEKIPSDTLQSILDDPERLKNVLTFHVVSGKLTASDVTAKDQLETLQGTAAEVEIDGDTVRVAGAKIVKTDVMASNGVIHVIDGVMVPN